MKVADISFFDSSKQVVISQSGALPPFASGTFTNLTLGNYGTGSITAYGTFGAQMVQYGGTGVSGYDYTISINGSVGSTASISGNTISFTYAGMSGVTSSMMGDGKISLKNAGYSSTVTTDIDYNGVTTTIGKFSTLSTNDIDVTGTDVLISLENGTFAAVGAAFPSTFVITNTDASVGGTYSMLTSGSKYNSIMSFSGASTISMLWENLDGEYNMAGQPIMCLDKDNKYTIRLYVNGMEQPWENGIAARMGQFSPSGTQTAYASFAEMVSAHSTMTSVYSAASMSGTATLMVTADVGGGGSSVIEPGTVSTSTVSAVLITGSTFSDGTRKLSDYPAASGGTNGQVMMISNGTWGYGTVSSSLPANASFTRLTADTVSSMNGMFTLNSSGLTSYGGTFCWYGGYVGRMLWDGGLTLSGTVTGANASGSEQYTLGTMNAIGYANSTNTNKYLTVVNEYGGAAYEWKSALKQITQLETTSLLYSAGTGYSVYDETSETNNGISYYRVTPASATEATYLLPSVSDTTVDHSIRVEVNFATVSTVAFKTSAGTAIELQKEITIESGSIWMFMCQYAGGAWKVYPVEA